MTRQNATCRLVAVVVTGAVLLSAATAQEPDAKAIVDLAVAGAGRLPRLKAFSYVGVSQRPNGRQLTTRYWVQPPDKFRIESSEPRNPNWCNEKVIVINGGKGWDKSFTVVDLGRGPERSLQDPREMSKEDVARAVAIQRFGGVRLDLALRDPAFTYRLVPGEREAAVLEVRDTQGTERRLYFDPKTGRNTKVTTSYADGGVRQTEVRLEDYTSVGGVTFPGKRTHYVGSSMVLVEELRDLTFVDQFDAKLFDMP